MESALTEGLGAFAVTACAAGAAGRAMSPAAVTISPVRRDAGWNLKRASLGSGQALLACPGVAWQWALGSRRRQEGLGTPPGAAGAGGENRLPRHEHPDKCLTNPARVRD